MTNIGTWKHQFKEKKTQSFNWYKILLNTCTRVYGHSKISVLFFFNILCHMMYQCQIENYPLVSQDVLHFISSFKSYVHISNIYQYELWIRKNSDNWELKKICWRVSYRYFQDRKINLNFILLAKQICMLF